MSKEEWSFLGIFLVFCLLTLCIELGLQSCTPIQEEQQ